MSFKQFLMKCFGLEEVEITDSSQTETNTPVEKTGGTDYGTLLKTYQTLRSENGMDHATAWGKIVTDNSWDGDTSEKMLKELMNYMNQAPKPDNNGSNKDAVIL